MLCTLTVGLGAWNLDHFLILSRAEEAFRNIIVDGSSSAYGRLSDWPSALLMLAMAVFLALPKIERPFMMLVFSLMSWAVYLFIVVAIPIRQDFILPIVWPVLMIVGGMALVGTVAWQRERANRLHAEDLDRSRQLLVDMLVHDIRQRSATVLTTMSLLKKNADDTSLTLIQSGIERILMLLSNLMDIRKADQGPLRVSLRPLDVESLVRESIQDHQAAAELVHVTLEVRCQPGLQIMGDSNLLRRVLTNLLWNALQHAPAGTPVEIQCASGQSAVEIRIVNEGAVIPAAEQAAIFTPFAAGQSVSASPTSTGLGLVFCKHAMAAHGGSIQLESPPSGKSTGVAVRLVFAVVG